MLLVKSTIITSVCACPGDLPGSQVVKMLLKMTKHSRAEYKLKLLYSRVFNVNPKTKNITVVCLLKRS